MQIALRVKAHFSLPEIRLRHREQQSSVYAQMMIHHIHAMTDPQSGRPSKELNMWNLGPQLADFE